MSSAARREQILEAAAQIIMARGLSSCSLECVADELKVSKALVYRHFPNREAMLHWLMAREFEEIRGRRLGTAGRYASIEQYYRTRTPRYFGYVKERGSLLKALFSEPAVFDLLVEENRAQRRDTYRLPEDLARLGTRLTINAPDNADRMLKGGEISVERAAEFWTAFVLGGWLAASARFAGQEAPEPGSSREDARPKA
jgi:AcrR family transcriptional regulator